MSNLYHDGIEADDEPCGCADKAKPGEYYQCPICDAEWFPEDEGIEPHPFTEGAPVSGVKEAGGMSAEALGRVIYDWLGETFGDDGNLPGGVQKFADEGDHLDPAMKHEARCVALAERILSALGKHPRDAEIARLREALDQIAAGLLGVRATSRFSTARSIARAALSPDPVEGEE